MYIGKIVREIDGNGKFVGHKFVVDGKVFRNVRCRYCGKWFSYEVKPNENEPAHCGNSACEYFHYRYIKHQAVKTDMDYDSVKRLFNNPQIVRSVIHKSKNLAQAGVILFNRRVPIDEDKKILVVRG